MTDNEIIGSFLNISGYDAFSNERRISTLWIALKQARKIVGRIIESGILLDEKMSIGINEEIMNEGRYHSCLLLGLTNYLIILDLIGSVFKLKNLTKSHSPDGIIHALKNFNSLDVEKIKAIKALRNSLTHNFGLANKSHIFMLSSSFPELIELPKDQDRWNISKEEERDNYTKVNEVKMCQLVEDIYNKLIIII